MNLKSMLFSELVLLENYMDLDGKVSGQLPPGKANHIKECVKAEIRSRLLGVTSDDVVEQKFEVSGEQPEAINLDNFNK